MIRAYLWRGLKAGVLAGLAFGLFVALAGNPLIGFAEGIGADDHGVADGHHHDHAAGDGADGHEGGHAVSMAVTNVVSVGGSMLWGLLLGVLVFGVVFYFLEPVLPGTGAVRSFVLAGAGFVTLAGSPWLVMPPQPGVEQSLPEDARFLWYAIMAIAGAVVCLLSFWLYDRLEAGNHPAVAGAIALLPFSLLGVLALVAPANTFGGAVPDTIVRAFQGVVVLGQVALWGTMATAHAWLHQQDRTGTAESDFGTYPEQAD